MAQRIAIGSDHAGVDLKGVVKDHLAARGMQVVDKGTHSKDSVDYPDQWCGHHSQQAPWCAGSPGLAT